MTTTGRGEHDTETSHVHGWALSGRCVCGAARPGTETRAGEAEAVEAATHQMRMVLMGTGALTLAQVDEHAEPLARSMLGFVLPKFAAAVRAEHGERVLGTFRALIADEKALGDESSFYASLDDVSDFVTEVAARLAREAQS